MITVPTLAADCPRQGLDRGPCNQAPRSRWANLVRGDRVREHRTRRRRSNRVRRPPGRRSCRQARPSDATRPRAHVRRRTAQPREGRIVATPLRSVSWVRQNTSRTVRGAPRAHPPTSMQTEERYKIDDRKSGAGHGVEIGVIGRIQSEARMLSAKSSACIAALRSRTRRSGSSPARTWPYPGAGESPRCADRLLSWQSERCTANSRICATAGRSAMKAESEGASAAAIASTSAATSSGLIGSAPY